MPQRLPSAAVRATLVIVRDERPPTGDDDSGTSLRTGFSLSEMDLSELWVACIGLGGSFTKQRLEQGLRGTHTFSGRDHDVVAQALNDYFTERGQDHPVAYHDELAERRRRTTGPTGR